MPLRRGWRKTIDRFRKRKGVRPYRSRKSTYKRSTYKRRYNNRVNVPVLSSLLQKRVFHKFKYTNIYNLTTSGTAGAASVYEWRSSIFDPDFTGTGHQPYLHDQWGTFYTYYRVYGFAYNCRVVGTGTNTPIILMVHHNSYNQSTTLDPEVNGEMPQCVSTKILDPRVSTVTFKGYISLPKVEGMSKTEFKGDAGYEAAFGANPVKYAKMSLVSSSPGVSQTYTVVMTMWLYTEMWGLVNVAKS